MSLIRARNSLTDIATKTFITDPVSAGGSVFHVKNTNTFDTNWAIQAGNTGEERSEIKIISTISGLDLITTGTAIFEQPTDSPVYAIKYDKVVFKRSTSGTIGVASPLGTVTIQPDQAFTQYDDTTAQAGYAYKASFLNSVTLEETADSDWLTPAGYSFYSRSKIRDRIREKLFDSNFIQNDETINNWINEWLENMNNAAIHVNQDYSIGTVDVAFGTAGLGTISTGDFKDIRRMWITTDGNSFYSAQRIQQTDFAPQQVFPNTLPAYYPFGDKVFGVKPDGMVGTARISYYTQQTVLKDDGDELPNVMQTYSKSFVDYGLAQALMVDNKMSAAQQKLNDAERAMSLFISDITPRSYSGPRYIKIVDDIDGEGGYI